MLMILAANSSPVWRCTHRLTTEKAPLQKGGFYTGCSLNIVFSEDFKIYIYSGLWPLFVSPRCQSAYTMAGQTPPALQQSLQSSEKSRHKKEKHNI